MKVALQNVCPFNYLTSKYCMNINNDKLRLVIKSPLTMRKRLMFVINKLSHQYESQSSPIRIRKITLADGYSYRIK